MADRSDFLRPPETQPTTIAEVAARLDSVYSDPNPSLRLRRRQPSLNRDAASAAVNGNGAGTKVGGRPKFAHEVPVSNGGLLVLDQDIRALATLIAKSKGVSASAMKRAVVAAEKAIADALSGPRPTVRDLRRKARRVRSMAAASAALTQPKRTVAKARKGVKQTRLPVLPKGLSWPKNTYRESGLDIVSFLEAEWSALIAAGYGELRWLRLRDPSAVEAIKSYERKKPATQRRRLPKHLHFLSEREVNDRDLARLSSREELAGNPRLAAAFGYRLHRGLDAPHV